MKLNLFLVLILSGLNLFAADNEVVKREAMEKFYHKEQEEFQQDYRDRKNKSEKATGAEKLIDAVKFITTSRMLTKDIVKNNFKFALEDCNDLCVEHGTSNIQKNVLSTVSKDTQVCQNFCTSYKNKADAYLSGVEFGLSQNVSTGDCTGAVNSSTRGKEKEKEKKYEALTPSVRSMTAPK